MTEQKCTCQKVPELNYVSSDPNCPVHYPKIDREKGWAEEFEEYYKTCLTPNQLEGKNIYYWAKAFWLESRRRWIRDEVHKD